MMTSHAKIAAGLQRTMRTIGRNVGRGISPDPSRAGNIVFGPVPSRRLGRSLGINNLRAKSCSYDCVYCQAGPTTDRTISRGVCFEPYELFRLVKKKIARLGEERARIDFISFVPSGEPTLDLALAKSLRLLREFGFPTAVFTNSSLLWDANVREGLVYADYVSVKVDAVTESVWQSINQPHRRLNLGAILDGVAAFADSYQGVLTTETMLVKNINDTIDEVGKIGRYLQTLRRRRSYFGIPVRPPARSFAVGPDPDVRLSLSRFIGETLIDAELLFTPEGSEFEATGDVDHEILAIITVHPMSEEAIENLLERKGVARDRLRDLVVKNMLRPVQFEGKTFYTTNRTT
jgi:wyosine [tRNA(Phe)-imidazoG37] synthetase (radical SAM superfamily)